MTAPLSIQGVTLRYGGVVAVSDLSWEVPAGGLLGLVGPNGSGKTSLLNVISRVASPQAGTLRLDGVDYTRRTPEAAARMGIARTFQAIRLISSLTVRSNVMIGADLRAGSSGLLDAWFLTPRLRRAEGASRRIADGVLERLGLADLADEYPANLPYGVQRRVEIARAIATSPRLLLLDEPAAGMNTAESDAVAATLLALRKEGMTQILVEHNLRMVMNICDEVLVMDFGRRIASGRPEAVVADPAVREAYLGEADDSAA
jgi:ABC-type branched-subunit amino acid transport system ATPase component